MDWWTNIQGNMNERMCVWLLLPLRQFWWSHLVSLIDQFNCITSLFFLPINLLQLYYPFLHASAAAYICMCMLEHLFSVFVLLKLMKWN